MTRTIRLDTARRIAISAQGLAGDRPGGRVDVRHFRRVLRTLGIVQLDSVNVLARAHYLPFFSRLGAYDRAALDRWLWDSGELFEYWGHEASLMPIAHRPMLGHRMAEGRHWPAISRMRRDHPGLIEHVLAVVTDHGPLTSSDLETEERSGSWWGWTNTKRALEYLFMVGALAVAGRPNFQRLYDIPERVHPEVAAVPAVDATEARTELLAVAAAAHGIGTIHDLADYHRMKIGDARKALPPLIERGDVEQVDVEGWSEPAYVHRSAAAARRLRQGVLLAPFDPLVWFRPRIERLFGFHYRIEIYVPAPKRRYGYYVLPFMSHGRLTARVDLKADRARSTLMVRGAFAEPEVEARQVAEMMVPELREMGRWLELDRIEIGDKGDLVGILAKMVES